MSSCISCISCKSTDMDVITTTDRYGAEENHYICNNCECITVSLKAGKISLFGEDLSLINNCTISFKRDNIKYIINVNENAICLPNPHMEILPKALSRSEKNRIINIIGGCKLGRIGEDQYFIRPSKNAVMISAKLYTIPENSIVTH